MVNVCMCCLLILPKYLNLAPNLAQPCVLLARQGSISKISNRITSGGRAISEPANRTFLTYSNTCYRDYFFVLTCYSVSHQLWRALFCSELLKVGRAWGRLPHDQLHDDLAVGGRQTLQGLIVLELLSETERVLDRPCQANEAGCLPLQLHTSQAPQIYIYIYKYIYYIQYIIVYIHGLAKARRQLHLRFFRFMS